MKISTLKRTLLLCSLCITLSTARAQYVAIPDSNFGNWIHTTSATVCLVGNLLDTICAQNNPIADTIPTNGALYLDLSYLNIADFTGMQYLRFSVAYQDFNSGGAWVTVPSFYSVNLSHNALTSFPDPIMTIITAPNSGDYTDQTVDLSYNFIDTFILNPSRDVFTMNLSHNNIRYFGLATSNFYDLQNINLDYNDLTSLPSFYYRNRFFVTQNCLISLSARHNQLLNCPSGYFNSLNVGANQITNFSYSSPCYYGIGSLVFDSNMVTSVNINSPSIGYLNASYNQIVGFNISQNGSPCTIGTLVCNNNNIVALPELTTSLSHLDCHNNPNLSCLPPLPFVNALYLNIDSTLVSCLPDRYNSCTYTGSANINAMPICDYSNSTCPLYQVISGRFYIDFNNNCMLDSGESGLRDEKVLLFKNGQYVQMVYTDSSGYYGFTLSDSGSYTVSFADTMFLNSCMSNGGIPIDIVSNSSASFEVDFGVSCKTNSIPDYGILSIVSPTIHSFRSSTITQLEVSAANLSVLGNINCAPGLPGSVSIYYSGTVQYAGTIPGALAPSSVNGNLLTYNLVNLDSLNAGSLGILFSTDSGSVIGSTVCITAIVSSIPQDNLRSDDTLTQCFVIHDPHDPNLKSVYPLDTFYGAKWLTYTVDFQNTGNDTAHRIVIRDTLGQYVDASSFQFLGASDNVLVQLINNAVAFTFPKINLVDSATDPALSTGWIQYKVKALPNLPLNTQVENTAYIYFDLNPAVVTNTTINTVDTVVTATCHDTISYTNHTICQGDSFVYYGVAYGATGFYSDTMQTVGGCDSILVLNLTVAPPTYDTISQSICVGNSYSLGGHTFTAQGIYTDTLTSLLGCDSIVTLQLTVNPLPVVTLTWDSLFNNNDLLVISDDPTGDTLWCIDGSPGIFPMSGGMPLGGNYSGGNIQNDTFDFYVFHYLNDFDTITYVYVDANGCSNSAQNYFILAECEGINSISSASPIHLYPNPNHGTFTLETYGSTGATYTITDMLGKVIVQSSITSSNEAIDIHQATEGIYTLTLTGANPIRFVIIH